MVHVTPVRSMEITEHWEVRRLTLPRGDTSTAKMTSRLVPLRLSVTMRVAVANVPCGVGQSLASWKVAAGGRTPRPRRRGRRALAQLKSRWLRTRLDCTPPCSDTRPDYFGFARSLALADRFAAR